MDIFRQFNEAMPTVMVTGGERFLIRFETQIWLDEGLLDVVQTDCNVTGITENWYISQMAHARGIKSIPHNWHGGGTIRHDDLWRPPVDYEPWEHDDDPRYDGLPAGGRLAYSYPLVFEKAHSGRYLRLTYVPLKDRGMGLSEVQIFDHASSTRRPR